MIPKRLHYVWVGGEMPRKQRAYIDSWRTTNPDYEIVGWNEENIDLTLPPIAHAYARRRWSTVADIVRLMAVHEQGGIYLDTDFQVYRSLDRLLEHRCFFAFQHQQHPTDWVCNGVFGAVPGHPIIARARDAVLQLSPSRFGLHRPTRYGPKLVTRLLREAGLRHYSPAGVMVGDVFVCPTSFFFPFSHDETFNEACIGSDTLAAHFWEKSWEKDVPLPIRWAQSMRRMLPSLPR